MSASEPEKAGFAVEVGAGGGAAPIQREIRGHIGASYPGAPIPAAGGAAASAAAAKRAMVRSKWSITPRT